MSLRLAFLGTPDFAGEARPTQPGKSVQWTDLSGERPSVSEGLCGTSSLRSDRASFSRLASLAQEKLSQRRELGRAAGEG